MTAVKIQDCGCIALPEELVEKISLYPGSTLDVILAPDGKSLQLIPLTRVPRSVSSPEGTVCG